MHVVVAAAIVAGAAPAPRHLVGRARADATPAHRGRRGGRRERDRRGRRLHAATAARRSAPTRTRPRATPGVASPIFRSASTTRWRWASEGRRTCSEGIAATGATLRSALVLERRSLARAPTDAVSARSRGRGCRGRRIVVAGGIGEGRRLARAALVYDLRTRRWSSAPGPTPREHLGVTSFAGTVYAIAGRTSGLDTNLLHFESWRPGQSRWRRLQPIPDSRGGTGAAALRGQVVSAGGEEPDGTIREVLAYRIAEKRWVRLADLPSPRHGVGVAALAGRVYVIGGGPEPGLTVSSANESIDIAGSASAGTSLRNSDPRRPGATRGCERAGSDASRGRRRRWRA